MAGPKVKTVVEHLSRLLTTRERRGFEDADGADDDHIHRDELHQTDLIVGNALSSATPITTKR